MSPSTTQLEAPTPEVAMEMIKDVPITRRWRSMIETIAAAAPEPVDSQTFYQPPLNWTPSILEGVHHSLHIWVNAVLPRCPWDYQLTADQEPVQYRMKPTVATIYKSAQRDG